MNRLSKSEREELEWLRMSAAKFITCPLEKAFFYLEELVEKPPSGRVDAILPSSAFYVLARAVIELKKHVVK